MLSIRLENPENNVPLAVLGGTVLAAIINISSTSIIFGIVPDSELAASTAPFGLVFARMFSPLVGQLINACFIVACVESLCGWQFTVANVVRDSARAVFFSKIPYQGYSQRNTDGCADLPYSGSDGYGADDDFSIAE